MYQGFISFMPSNIPLYGYTTFCLSTYQLMDIWVVSLFVPVMNNAAVNINVKVFVWAHVFISLGVKLWVRMITLH